VINEPVWPDCRLPAVVPAGPNSPWKRRRYQPKLWTVGKVKKFALLLLLPFVNAGQVRFSKKRFMDIYFWLQAKCSAS
jgi:hypothetical protein